MKYYNKIIVFVLALFLTVGCQDKLEELFQNPDGFSKQAADASGVSVLSGYFTSQLTRGYFLRGDYGTQYHIQRSGQRILGSGIQTPFTIAEYGFSYALMDVENDWGTGAFNNAVFNNANSQWIVGILWGQREYNNIEDPSTLDELYMRLLHLLKAYVYQRAIDLYDEVPYITTGSAGALDGDKAVYKGQNEVYPIIIQEVKEIEEYLSTVELSNTEKTLFSAQDVLFNGNIEQWRKYANSLRLRWAMTVSEQMPELTSTVLSELQSKPIFDTYTDVAGIADLAIVDPARLQSELGITRAFRENPYTLRVPKKFTDMMNLIPVEEDAGNGLKYFVADNVGTNKEGLESGDVDPRVAYMISPDFRGYYFGNDNKWDNGNDKNSYLSKVVRGYYINDPCMTDESIDVFKITNPDGNGQDEIRLYENNVLVPLSGRDEFLRKKLRERVANNDDSGWVLGKAGVMTSEYNMRAIYNSNLRYPTLNAAEVQLNFAEAAVRGFGSTPMSAREHYKRAIELSCDFWYDLNVNNQNTKSTVPGFPNSMSDSRINDRPEKRYNASLFAEKAAQRFDLLSDQEKVYAIYVQLHMNYNVLNFEYCFTAARRLIKYLGDNPSNTLELYRWKERNTYPASIQASDPEAWSKISGHDNYDLPMWFTGRTEKWKNVLE